MGLATEETLTEIGGTSSHPTNEERVNPDTETAKSTVEGEGQDAKGAADGSQGTDDPNKDAGKDTSKDAGDGKDKGDPDKKAASDTGDDGKKSKPYHEDPRWQEIMRERNEAREENKDLRDRVSKLEGAIEAYMNGTKAEQKEALEELPDLLNMSNEEIEEKLTKDPKGFIKTLYSQLRSDVKKEQKADRDEQAANDRQKAINKSYKDYADKHPDFETMWKKGDIQKYMDENPGVHTPLSAHAMLTMDARIKEEVDKQVAEKTKEIEENLLAKKRAGTLGKDTPAAHKESNAGASKDPALNNTKSRGGLTSVLAERLRLRRAAGQT